MAKDMNKHEWRRHTMASKHIKRYLTSFASRNCKVKPQWNTSTYSAEWWSGEDAEKLNHSYVAGGNVKLYNHFGEVW